MPYRCAFLLFLAGAVVQLVGCGSDDPPAQQPPPDAGGPLPGPEEWNREVTPPPDEEAAQKRLACGFQAGALPAETQGASQPNGKDIPIDHIVVVMMENRSFDHYFQKLPEYGQPDVEVAPATFTNPDAEGNPVAPFHDSQFCFVDTAHGWGAVHKQVNGGKMDGFVSTSEGNHELPVNGTLDMLSGKRAMGYYDETDLPFYYWLASEFAIADHYHCSVLGPTWPNRMFLYASTSFGLTHNTFAETGGADVLADRLEMRELDWKIYGNGFVGYAMLPEVILEYAADHRFTLDEFFADAAAGTLPQVAFVDPELAGDTWDANDEHPPAMAQFGERFAAEVVQAMTKSPSWSRSAMFLTYDEHGGLYDHVVPPAACPPDDRPSVYNGDEFTDVGFDQLGIRVPMMVISPYAKKHFVGHRTYDHTSIARFIQARFVIPALTNRDANAEAPWEMFDFAAPPHATPPEIPMPPEVDPAKRAACESIFDG
jgi:phospholipase C